MTLAGKTVMVTGATGFLGGWVARRLAAEGANVRALVRSPQKVVALESGGICPISGDLTQPDDVTRAAEGCEVIFHAAVDYTTPQRQQVVNVDGTRHVMQAAADVGAARVVHVSSIAVYGYKVSGDVYEDAPYGENNDPYAITKIAAERIVRAMSAHRSVAHTIVRPGCIYGPGSGMWTVKMFRLARLKPTPFLGDGSGSAQPIYVDDVADMMLVAATHDNAANRAFNCAPDPAPSWRSFLGAYMACAGHDRWLGIPYSLVNPIVHLIARVVPRTSQWRDLPDFAGMTGRRITYCMDSARDLLGWSPRVPLDEGIAASCAWLREQRLLR